MEEYEVCSFCGEVFKGEQIKDYQNHYVKCRDGYIDEFDSDDVEGNFYLYGDD